MKPIPANNWRSFRQYPLRLTPGTKETNPLYPWYRTWRGWRVDPDFRGVTWCDPPDWWDGFPEPFPLSRQWFSFRYQRYRYRFAEWRRRRQGLPPLCTYGGELDMTMTAVEINPEEFAIFNWMDKGSLTKAIEELANGE